MTNSKLRLFTSESVTEGHPDKICDQISDAILDELLRQDPNSRVAVETMVTTGLVHVAGEVRTQGYADIAGLVRKTINEIGYHDSSMGFDGDDCGVSVSIGSQSANIYAAVDRVGGDIDELDSGTRLGAGDQGLMFGYADRSTPQLMPLPIWLAHRLAERLTTVRKNGTLDYLRPDGKTQVTIAYDGDTPVAIDTVVVSSQHATGFDLETLRHDITEHVVRPVLRAVELDHSNTRILINTAGPFEIGGPKGDAGLTGRKIIVDTYGGFARHGGGAFSGKDPSKVDRSAAYAMRWAAKTIVASGAADRAEVQVAYAIGVNEPVGFYVETFGTEKVDPASIAVAVRELFDLRPGKIIEELDLERPIYRQTAAYGHFGRELPDFTWESTSRKDDLARALGL